MGLPANAQLKLLSRDAETGEFSAVVQFPAQAEFKPQANRDAEFLVLAGQLTVTGELFERYHYGFIPAGRDATVQAGPSGAAVLFFTSAVREDSMRTADAVSRRITPKCDLNTGRWDGDFDKFNLGSMKEGARMRLLREDPYSGETTYLTATIAFRRGSEAERHPISQEFFLLSGELAGERGIMQAGAYCIRPPMAKHGPYGSPTGALILFRGLGGPQQTFWEPAAPFRFDPPFDPILPDELERYSKPVERIRVY